LVLFAALLSLSLAQYQVVSGYSNSGCNGDPIVWVVTLVSSGACVDAGCNGAGGYSSQISCSAGLPSFPNGVVGYSEYPAADCAGEPTTLLGYTSGCICDPTYCYQTTCNTDGSLGAAIFPASNGGCSGTPTDSGQYKPGCISAGSTSIQQTSCSSGGASVDWNGFLGTWLSGVGQSWTIPTFAATTYYKSNGQWTINGNTVSVDITFTGSEDSTTIDAFVVRVCSDMIQNANAGVCGQSSATSDCVSNPSPCHADCTWVTVTSKRQTTASVITMNAKMSSGVMVTGFLGLIVSLLVLLL